MTYHKFWPVLSLKGIQACQWYQILPLHHHEKLAEVDIMDGECGGADHCQGGGERVGWTPQAFHVPWSQLGQLQAYQSADLLQASDLGACHDQFVCMAFDGFDMFGLSNGWAETIWGAKLCDKEMIVDKRMLAGKGKSRWWTAWKASQLMWKCWRAASILSNASSSIKCQGTR